MSVVKGRKNSPLGRTISGISKYLNNAENNKDVALLGDFLLIAEKMREKNSCAQKSCSVYIWKGFDMLSLNANGGAPYWELSNTVGPSAKKYPLKDWKDAYDALNENADSTG